MGYLIGELGGLIPVPGGYLRPVPQGGQPPGQDPRIGARFDDGSRFGDYGLRALARTQGAKHGRVVQHRVRHLGQLAPAPEHQRNTALDLRLRLLRSSTRSEGNPDRHQHRAVGHLGAALLHDFHCLLGQQSRFLTTTNGS